MAIDIESLVAEMKGAATQILGDDIASIRGFSERQMRAIAQQAKFVEQGIINGQITEETRDFFLDNLKDLVRGFVRTLQGLVIVTMEKLWNAIVGVIWRAIKAATNAILPDIGSFA